MNAIDMIDQENEILRYIEKERDFMWSQALGLTRKSEDAEDLFQDTILKACKGWHSFDPDTNFKAWIGRIMLNTHINNYNRNKGHLNCDFTTGEFEAIISSVNIRENVTFNDNPEKIFFNNHIDKKVMEALYSLPDSYKIPFMLYHMEGYSYEEIAAVSRLPLGTVKSRLFRARKYLRDMIEGVDYGSASDIPSLVIEKAG